MEQSYRIRANVGADQVIRTTLQQDIDMLEILSLKIKQSDVYKLHTSNYGMIVGRVLANEVVGIFNAKVSVFVELDDIDKRNSEITQFYPFETIYSQDENGVRYNLLKDSSNDECYQEVGTFPNKRLVLDNDTMIEIFDKYWKYTTVTNQSGDYMIPCVPVGNQQIHVDIDLSDIGVLSQKPRDFMYKGYNITQFDNANQFKDSTNLDNLSQIISQNTSVYVYPFWGSEDVGEVAITRCDIQVAYKFEPTCVFFGSIVSDNFSNNIGHKCNPSKFVGFNRNLVAGEGVIEMIRKTPDGLVEDFQIQGNRLIDGNGVWCYQIPMNLDYVMTDEFGNIVPADGNKGIATRTSVRFRISMQETNSEGISRHRARYLVPNVHQLVDTFGSSTTQPMIADPSKYDQCYEFGSATPDEFFRDLYWNKVYTVKNYIPRIQRNGQKNTQKYSAIRTVNDNGNLNPFPFNHGRFRLVFGYRVLCVLMSIVFKIMAVINTFLSSIVCLKFLGIRPFKFLCALIKCIAVRGGLTEDEDSNVEYFPGCKRGCSCMMKCEQKGCQQETSYQKLMDTVQQNLSQEYDVVNLDFYNDWVNGTLYMPLWFWKKTKKRKFLFGLFSQKAKNAYCSCDTNYPKLRVTENCSIPWLDTEEGGADSDETSTDMHHVFPSNAPRTIYGIVKEVENKDGLKLYYYAPGVPNIGNYRNTTEPSTYVRLYSTDIVLLGSLNECDLDNLPRPFINLPSTTSNIPYIRTLTETASSNDDDESTLEGTMEEEGGVVQVTGMDWESGGGSTRPKFGRGLLMDMTCIKIRTRPKSCINLSRMSELGVGLDITVDNEIPEGGTLKYNNTQIADGMITRYEIVDHETRAMFASLNHNGLMEKVRNKNTGYDTYKLEYTYLNDFDGRMKDASAYTSMMEFKTYDIADQSYVNFRLGKVMRKDDNGEYKRTTSHFYDGKEFPLFNNSFFFYFGLNEGNTAIDKFNNLFYASCYKNQKYPFSLTYTTAPAKWCKDGEDGLRTDYGTMDITFKGIKVPYSYTLYNNFGEEIISESNVYTTDLKFGYESDGHKYMKDANGNLKKYGLFTPFGEPSSAITSGTYVENGVYVIEVKDANGSSLKQSLTLHQMGISVTTESINLGDKFYSSIEEDGSIKPISTANDFCGENIDLYGEIIVKQIDIDGKHYGVETISATTTPNQYELKLTNKDDNTDTEEVILTLSLVDGGSGEDCMCPEVSGEPKSHTYVLEDGQLTFHVWQPQTYKIHVVQKCNEGVNDNEMTTNVVIANGEPFNAYLNDMPVKFMLNSNFYTPNNTATTLSATSIKGWMNLHNPANYSWPIVSYRNANTWGDFTDVEVVASGATSALTLTSKLNILEYQINSMFNLCRSAYVVGSGDNTMTISSTGGKGPILYRGNYPLYSDIPDDSSIESTYDGWLFDSDGTVTCNPKFPNIVGENYTLYYGETDYYIPLIRWNHEVFEKLKNTRAFLNPIYQESGRTGNYFAVFTNNGGIKKIVTDTSSSCSEDPNAAYQASPSNAQPIDTICPGFSDEIFSGSTYLRGFFTDKRFDYDMIIWAPTYYEITQQASTSNDNDWKLGRISGVTYNGVEMAYDGEYNIIGKDLEYEVSGGTLIDEFDSKDYQLSHKTKNEKRRQYSSTLKMDNQTIDLREIYQNRGDITYPMRRELNIPITGDIKIQPSQKMKFTNITCSYDIEVASESTEGGVVFTGVIEPGEETTFTVDCRSQISVVSSGLSTMAQADKADLYYASNGGVQHVDFKFKIGQDKYNKTHNITTFLPFFWRAPDGEGVEYLFNLIKEIKKVDKFEDLMKQLVENTYKHGSGYKNAHGTKDIWKQAEYDGSLRPMTDDIRCDTLNTDYARYLWYSGDGDRAHHWFEDDDRNKIVYDDDSRVRNIIYSIDRPTQALAIVLLRQYLNAEDDNLSKNIMLLNTSTIFDFTKNISVTCGTDNNWTYTSTNLSGKTDKDVVTDVDGGDIDVSTDKDDNVTGVTGGGVSSEEEKVGVTTSSVTSYENSIQIKVNTNDPGWNNGSGENGMEALLVVNKQYHLATSIISDGGETSAISDSSFSTIFQFNWSSANFKDMLGPEKPDKAESGNAECLMFVKLNDNKQKMVAKLKFKIGWNWDGSSYSLTSLTLNNSK